MTGVELGEKAKDEIEETAIHADAVYTSGESGEAGLGTPDVMSDADNGSKPWENRPLESSEQRAARRLAKLREEVSKLELSAAQREEAREREKMEKEAARKAAKVKAKLAEREKRREKDERRADEVMETGPVVFEKNYGGVMDRSARRLAKLREEVAKLEREKAEKERGGEVGEKGKEKGNAVGAAGGEVTSDVQKGDEADGVEDAKGTEEVNGGDGDQMEIDVVAGNDNEVTVEMEDQKPLENEDKEPEGAPVVDAAVVLELADFEDEVPEPPIEPKTQPQPQLQPELVHEQMMSAFLKVPTPASTPPRIATPPPRISTPPNDPIISEVPATDPATQLPNPKLRISTKPTTKKPKKKPTPPSPPTPPPQLLPSDPIQARIALVDRINSHLKELASHYHKLKQLANKASRKGKFRSEGVLEELRGATGRARRCRERVE
ncbi:hypothetical protein HK097_006444, partial [Rhizophlyctis rosea]